MNVDDRAFYSPLNWLGDASDEQSDTHTHADREHFVAHNHYQALASVYQQSKAEKKQLQK